MHALYHSIKNVVIKSSVPYANKTIIVKDQLQHQRYRARFVKGLSFWCSKTYT